MLSDCSVSMHEMKEVYVPCLYSGFESPGSHLFGLCLTSASPGVRFL